ncbi:hypothetical protein N658DRAFT_339476 [Parathielavia hyrcaniae]|uniref:Uncharacterized protein n=1 Tax=Parathielavia hyrcaniae TaxID=113614 RepID=A0AAN6Q441_9PEZI|nr:hypothetical protein N658DRAFT_339476 [Parathielavia hyrcaniae]
MGRSKFPLKRRLQLSGTDIESGHGIPRSPTGALLTALLGRLRSREFLQSKNGSRTLSASFLNTDILSSDLLPSFLLRWLDAGLDGKTWRCFENAKYHPPRTLQPQPPSPSTLYDMPTLQHGTTFTFLKASENAIIHAVPASSGLATSFPSHKFSP